MIINLHETDICGRGKFQVPILIGRNYEKSKKLASIISLDDGVSIPYRPGVCQKSREVVNDLLRDDFIIRFL